MRHVRICSADDGWVRKGKVASAEELDVVALGEVGSAQAKPGAILCLEVAMRCDAMQTRPAMVARHATRRRVAGRAEVMGE